jgi:capsule biosynthesis phosphatase
MSDAPVVVMDLDGTICTQETHENYPKAKPYKAVIARMKRLREYGWKIKIFTARGMIRYGGYVQLIELNMRKMTEQWLKDNDVPYDELIFGKPVGDLYVDDKGANVSEFAER